jgi:cyclophilin family peptidyl-prolyl cis-trans isomerase
MKKRLWSLVGYGLTVLHMISPTFGQQADLNEIANLNAPDSFQAVFTTTKGDFVIEACRNWSPEGVDRLYQLIQSGFYNNNCIFRVQPEYVVQFGISDNATANFFWDKRPVADEPVKGNNLKGVVSYARDGANTRTTQLFVNMKDNFKLDTVNYNGLRGFPPVAKVVRGFEVIESLYAEYGFEPANHQDSVMVQGNSYWQAKFPGLDYIIEAKILPEER